MDGEGWEKMKISPFSMFSVTTFFWVHFERNKREKIPFGNFAFLKRFNLNFGLNF